MELGVRLDVPFHEGGDLQPALASIGEGQLDRRPRLVAQRAARARVQDEIGEGSHGRIVPRAGGRTGEREYGPPTVGAAPRAYDLPCAPP